MTVLTGPIALGYRILHDFPNSCDQTAWRDFLTHADWPSHYTSPEFFLEPFWKGRNPFAVLAFEGNRVIAVLTGLHEGNTVTSGLSNRPQICFDRAIDRSRAALTLAEGLLEESHSAGLVTVYAWTALEALQSVGFTLKSFEGNIVLDLTQELEKLRKQSHENRRRNIRQAMKQGVAVQEASSEEDITDYYEVYRQWRQTVRKKIEGELVRFHVFANAYKLSDSRRLFVARHAGKIVAGTTVRFSRGGVLEYAANSSIDGYTHLHPNDLLIWKTIEWGSAMGFVRYSLGGSHPFLRKAGGTLFPIYRHRLDRTWLHRYDSIEAVVDRVRKTVLRFPLLATAIRRLLGRKHTPGRV
jgi:hypothetical protein